MHNAVFLAVATLVVFFFARVRVGCQSFRSCCTQALQDAANQLSSLVQKGLPERQHYRRKLLTAALRRDVWALRAAQPSFGVSDIPMD